MFFSWNLLIRIIGRDLNVALLKMSGIERFSFSRFGDTRKIVSNSSATLKYYKCFHLFSGALSIYLVSINWNLFLSRLQTNDTEGYDEYVEGVEPDETSSLETPIKEVNTPSPSNIRQNLDTI